MEARPTRIPPLKLAVLQNIVAPTRHALFRALAERVDLTVFFMARREPTRGWRGDEELDYPHRFLSGLHVSLPARGDVDAAHLNPGVVSALTRGRFDALLCGGWISPTSWLALLAARRAGTRFLLWSGTAWRSNGPRAALALPLKRRIVAAADAFVVYGDIARERLLELGADADRVCVATNTTDVRAFADAPRVDGPPTALWVGRFVARKRADLAIDLLARVSRDIEGLRCVFVGDGPLRAAAERHARGVGLDASFLGEIPYERLPEIYAAASILVTLAEREPWGLVVNEALAAGVPVLAGPEVIAARELVPPEGGCISADAEVLADTAVRLLADVRALAAAREAARSALPQLLPERWADAVVAAASASAGAKAGA